jgi:hypothetical protein
MIEPWYIGPTAPTIFVNKISGIYRLSPNKGHIRAFQRAGRRRRGVFVALGNG